MFESFKNKRILIVCAHPDDEVLGLGATMHRLIRSAEVRTKVVILGEGLTSRADQRDVAKWEKSLALHRANIDTAQAAIGYHELSVHDFPDNRFDSVALLDIIKVVEREKTAFKPDIIFTHHNGDLNVDHRLTFEAVMTATRPMAHEKTQAIICFETPSGTEWRSPTDPKHFLPNFFVPFGAEDLEAKQQAMEAYEFERRAYPHPRSPEALEIQAKRWGVVIGRELAEAFCLVRGIA